MSDDNGMDKIRTEFMIDLISRASELLLKVGVDGEEADRLAVQFAIDLARDWEGTHLYVPKNYRLRVALDHALIKADFLGNNHKELAARYSKHVRTIYKILA